MTSYARIFRHPHMALLLATVGVARLPIAINGLALVLFLHDRTGSFAIAGAAAGGLALGTGAAAPLMGRLVDRRGTRMLVPLAVLNAAGIALILVLGYADAPGVALVAAAVLTGAAYPPSPSVLRARFGVLLGDAPELLPTVYALDSVLVELSFVVAPLIVAAIVAVLEPAAALVFSGAAVLVGTVLFSAALPPAAAPAADRRQAGLLGALRSPGIRSLVLGMLPVGFAFGAMEVMLPAFGDAHGHRELAGVLLATWSIGSVAGGVVYGILPRRRPLATLHLALALLLPLVLLPLLVAPSIAVMALLLVPAGLPIAPIIASRNELAGLAALPGTETEALTWPLTALVSGVALGAAAGGALADGPGWHAIVIAAVAAAGVAALITVTRRGTYASQPRSVASSTA